MRDHPTERVALGNLLRVLRRRSGMSGAELAAVLKCSKPRISRLESGGLFPTRDQLGAYLAAVGAAPTDAADALVLHATIDGTPSAIDPAELAAMGARFAECRNRARLTQDQVAELANVRRHSIAQFEIGYAATTLTKFAAMCAAVGADANYVLGLPTDGPADFDDDLLDTVHYNAVAGVVADVKAHLDDILINLTSKEKD